MNEFYVNVARITDTFADGTPAYTLIFRTDCQDLRSAERTFRLLDRTLPTPEYEVTVHSRSLVRHECTSEFRVSIFPDHHDDAPRS